MGLELKKFINSKGYEVDKGYFIITSLSYDLRINSFIFTGDIYLSKEHYDEGFYPIDSVEYGLELKECPKDPVQYVYDYLKKADESYDPIYKGFIGCEKID